jgi:hypothetical protein
MYDVRPTLARSLGVVGSTFDAGAAGRDEGQVPARRRLASAMLAATAQAALREAHDGDKQETFRNALKRNARCNPRSFPASAGLPASYRSRSAV